MVPFLNLVRNGKEGSVEQSLLQDPLPEASLPPLAALLLLLPPPEPLLPLAAPMFEGWGKRREDNTVAQQNGTLKDTPVAHHHI